MQQQQQQSSSSGSDSSDSDSNSDDNDAETAAASTTAASEAAADGSGSGSDDTDAGTAAASAAADSTAAAAHINTSQPSPPGFKVTVAWPMPRWGQERGHRCLTEALQVPIIELLVARFTTATDDTTFFRIQYEDKGTIHVIVTDVPISLDDIHAGTIGDHLRAVAMIETEQHGDIAYLTTDKRYRKRGFGKACVYAAMDYFSKRCKDNLKIFSKPNTVSF